MTSHEAASAWALAGGARPPRLPKGITLPTDRMLVMGILNVTPDSSSDGGRFFDPGAAFEHAVQMVEAGADLVDLGGESTRPNSQRISEDEEWERIGATIQRLTEAGIVVSVDTLHAITARRAADAGAAIINDVSGGRWDPQMNAAVAQTSCAYVIQHYRALPGMPEESFDYGDQPIAVALRERVASQVRDALEAGVEPERIIVDPGLGFSLNNEQCWSLVASLRIFAELGYPVLIGASRKRFLGQSPLSDRDEATLDISRRALSYGMWAVRVHAIDQQARLVRAGR